MGDFTGFLDRVRFARIAVLGDLRCIGELGEASDSETRLIQ
jgi:hypothetical protein